MISNTYNKPNHISVKLLNSENFQCKKSSLFGKKRNKEVAWRRKVGHYHNNKNNDCSATGVAFRSGNFSITYIRFHEAIRLGRSEMQKSQEHP